MKYVAFQLDERVTVESPIDSEARAASQLFKQRYTRPFKRLLRWGVGVATRVQLGNLMGSLGAIASPQLAIPAALLIASLTPLVCPRSSRCRSPQPYRRWSGVGGAQWLSTG